MKTFSLAAIAMSSLIGVSSAYANPAEAPTIVVSYGDLDLSHANGVSTLYRRINQAARKVCAPLDVSQSVAPASMAEAHKTCLSNAVSGAVAKIDKPEFTAYVNAKTAPSLLKLASR